MPITMREIDALRGKCDYWLERRCSSGPYAPPEVAADWDRAIDLARDAVNAALAQWWEQGCKEVAPQAPPRPARCACGAYAWPRNMSEGGVIGDVVSRHRADKCWASPLDHAPGAMLAHLAEALFALTSDAPDSQFNADIVCWRQRVKETMIRNGIVLEKP